MDSCLSISYSIVFISFKAGIELEIRVKERGSMNKEEVRMTIEESESYGRAINARNAAVERNQVYQEERN